MTIEEHLAKAQANLVAFMARQADVGEFDHGIQNIPLAKRGNIDGELAKWRALNERVQYWQGRVDARRRRAAAVERLARERAAHADADLRARYGTCTQVQWDLNGRWYDVVRWSAKSVRVTSQAGGTTGSMTLPADQVAGAR